MLIPFWEGSGITGCTRAQRWPGCPCWGHSAMLPAAGAPGRPERLQPDQDWLELQHQSSPLAAFPSSTQGHARAPAAWGASGPGDARRPPPGQARARACPRPARCGRGLLARPSTQLMWMPGSLIWGGTGRQPPPALPGFGGK